MMYVNKISLMLGLINFCKVVQSATTVSSRHDIVKLISDTEVDSTVVSAANSITFPSQIEIPGGKFLALQASGAVTFDGNDASGLFNILPGGSLTLIGITLQNVSAV